YQNGGWTRSMPWSKAFPHLLDCMVMRASLPSTVSRKVMPQAAASPGHHAPCQNQTKAAITSSRLAKVTWLGVTPRRAQSFVAWKAGHGHSHLVTRSVAPL